MDAAQFLRTALGTNGHYCLFAKRGSTLRQEFYEDTDQLLVEATRLDEQGFDTYFALSTFSEPTKREANNAVELNALFLDLDCDAHESKKFSSQKEAVIALKKFCKSVALPKPTMVSSGYGIHVYWFLDEPVSKNKWWLVASQLKKLCQEHDFMYGADPAVPADAARVLRIPGTHNHKKGVARPVEIIGEVQPAVSFSEMGEKLGIAGDNLESPLSGVLDIGSVEDPLTATLTTPNKPSCFKAIILRTASGDGCAQIAHLVKNQEQVDEPLWRAGLSVAKFCEDGVTAIHKISNRHPEYSEQETNKKVEGIKGPYLCETFNTFNPGVCPKCPHWQKIKSPITLGQKDEGEGGYEVTDPKTHKSVIIPKYPWPYFRGTDGGVFVKDDSDEEESKKRIYYTDLYVVRRVWDKEDGESIMLRVHMPQDGIREFTIPNTIASTSDTLKKELAKYGVVARGNEIVSYLHTWLEYLQKNVKSSVSHRQFGWTENNESFVVGDKEVFADRIELNPPSTATAAYFKMFEPRGSLEEWQAAMEFFNKPEYKLHQFAIGTSFGSVLMGLTTMNACGFHMHSEGSGHGKTSAMRGGASVFGNPSDMMLKSKDTSASIFSRAEVYHSMMVPIDELTNMKADSISDYIYQLTDGKQRNRMQGGNNQERTRGEAWHLICVSTGNRSLINVLAAERGTIAAEIQRLFECNVEELKVPKSAADKFNEQVEDNYGHAGIPFVQHVIQHRELIRTQIKEMQAALERSAGMGMANRFWSVIFATTLVGMRHAKDIGLINYDVDELFFWSVEMIRRRIEMVSQYEADLHEILSNFLTDNWNNMLRIKSTSTSRGGTEVPPDALPRGLLTVRYETDISKAYIRIGPFRSWCVERGYDYNRIIRMLKEEMGANVYAMRLAKGTNMAVPTQRVIAVRCDVDELVSDSAGGTPQAS